MKDYDAVIILRAVLTDERVDALIARFGKKISDSGGSVTKTDKMGQRRIPFRMKKHKADKEGLYYLIQFKGTSETPKILRDELRVQEDVLRFMITIAPDAPKVLIDEKELSKEEQSAEGLAPESSAKGEIGG